MAARTTSPALIPALIAKMSPGGRGARGALNYDAQKDGARLLWTNLEGTTPRQWARGMKAFLSLNPRCRRGVDHVSLSLDPRLGTITDEEFVVAVKAWLSSMGYGDRAVVCHLHTDEPQLHVHLVICRIDQWGKVHADGGNWKRSHAAAVHAAEAIGLKPLPPRPDAAWAPAPTNTQIGANKRAKRRSTKVQNHASLARAFHHIVSKSSSLVELEVKLREVDIELQIVRKSGDVIQGLNVREAGAVEWQKASCLKSDRSLSWSQVEVRLAANLELRDRAQGEAEQVAEAARGRAELRVGAWLEKQPEAAVPQEARALLPEAANQETNTMAQLQQDAEGPLSFLSVSPSRPAGDDDARLVAGEGDAARARRIDEDQDRRKAAAEAELHAELEAATKTQLQRLRQALTNELHSHAEDAIERLLARLTRLVVRVLSMNQVILPPTDAERRIFVARHTIQRIDVELLHRQTNAAAEGQPKGRPSSPAAPLTPDPEKFVIMRPHDARQHQQSPADRDAVARELDAKRERNRTS